MRALYAVFVMLMISTVWFVGLTIFVYGGHWLLWLGQRGFNGLVVWVAREFDPIRSPLWLDWVSLPDLWWAVSVTLLAGVSLTGVSILGLALTPVRWRIRSILGARVYAGSEVAKIASEGLHKRFLEVKKGVSIRKPVSLRVAPVKGPVAFVVDAPFRAEVVVGSQLASTLTGPELEWVLAHELAHVRHRDLRWRSLWLASVRGLDRARAIQRRLVITKIWIMHRLRFPGVAISPVIWLWQTIWWSMRAGLKVARGVFLIGDRWMSRRMEFEADARAAQVISTAAGVSVLKRLGGDGEPEFVGVLATHPDPAMRVARLQRLGR